MIAENRKIIDLILVKQTAYQGRQKHEENIIMQSHEQSKSIAKYLKKHNPQYPIRSTFKCTLMSENRLTCLRPSP